MSEIPELPNTRQARKGGFVVTADRTAVIFLLIARDWRSVGEHRSVEPPQQANRIVVQARQRAWGVAFAGATAVLVIGHAGSHDPAGIIVAAQLFYLALWDFDQTCQTLGILHRLTPPSHPQTNGMVERFNGRISEVIRQTRFASSTELQTTLMRYCEVYNHHLPQRALNHQTPLRALKAWQEKYPELFVSEVNDQPGLQGTNDQPGLDSDVLP